MIVLPDWLPPDRPWPVDLKSYDRRVKLGASEKVALRLYVRRREAYQKAQTHHFQAALERLVRPLRDVMDLMAPCKERRTETINAVLRDVHRRRHAYWGWKAQDHRSPTATQHYVKVTPTRLAKSYSDAGYFERNVRMVEVLVDKEVVMAGSAGREPWRYFDLGHGYCTYEFFDQCPHRMACAKCAFYRPKGSTEAQLLEAKANLLRMQQAIPLKDEELAAVEEGVTAMERLLAQLVDVPTPAGPTPRQLQASPLVEIRPALEREA